MKKTACLALLMAAALALGGCAVSAEPAPAPAPEGATARAQVDWPKERLETDENGVPVLDVYVVADEQVERVDVETYVEGVLAGTELRLAADYGIDLTPEPRPGEPADFPDGVR